MNQNVVAHHSHRLAHDEVRLSENRLSNICDLICATVKERAQSLVK
jgi:hypothetical protein